MEVAGSWNAQQSTLVQVDPNLWALQQKYSVCRLCLCHGGLFDIFDTGTIMDIELKETIETLIQCPVEREEGFPWLVCHTCESKLTEFRLFKRRCLECKQAFDIRFKCYKPVVVAPENVVPTHSKVQHPPVNEGQMQTKSIEMEDSEDICCIVQLPHVNEKQTQAKSVDMEDSCQLLHFVPPVDEEQLKAKSIEMEEASQLCHIAEVSQLNLNQFESGVIDVQQPLERNPVKVEPMMEVEDVPQFNLQHDSTYTSTGMAHPSLESIENQDLKQEPPFDWYKPPKGYVIKEPLAEEKNLPRFSDGSGSMAMPISIGDQAGMTGPRLSDGSGSMAMPISIGDQAGMTGVALKQMSLDKNSILRVSHKHRRSVSLKEGTFCSVPNCRNSVYTKGIQYVKIPRNTELAVEMLNSIGRLDLLPSDLRHHKSRIICIDHFAPSVICASTGRLILGPLPEEFPKDFIQSMPVGDPLKKRAILPAPIPKPDCTLGQAQCYVNAPSPKPDFTLGQAHCNVNAPSPKPDLTLGQAQCNVNAPSPKPDFTLGQAQCNVNAPSPKPDFTLGQAQCNVNAPSPKPDFTLGQAHCNVNAPSPKPELPVAKVRCNVLRRETSRSPSVSTPTSSRNPDCGASTAMKSDDTTSTTVKPRVKAPRKQSLSTRHDLSSFSFPEEKEEKLEEFPPSPPQKKRIVERKLSCFVPMCPNKWMEKTKKLFASVPRDERRQKWLEAANYHDINARGNLFCCEDHFECHTTTNSDGKKAYVSVPLSEKRRILWFKAVRRDYHPSNKNTRFYCCTDHFKLEDDFKNYMEHKMTGCKLIVKEDIVPHIFDCHSGTRFAKTQVPRPLALKRIRKEIISEVLQLKKKTALGNEEQLQSSGVINATDRVTIDVPPSTSLLSEMEEDFFNYSKARYVGVRFLMPKPCTVPRFFDCQVGRTRVHNPKLRETRNWRKCKPTTFLNEDLSDDGSSSPECLSVSSSATSPAAPPATSPPPSPVPQPVAEAVEDDKVITHASVLDDSLDNLSTSELPTDLDEDIASYYSRWRKLLSEEQKKKENERIRINFSQGSRDLRNVELSEDSDSSIYIEPSALLPTPSCLVEVEDSSSAQDVRFSNSNAPSSPLPEKPDSVEEKEDASAVADSQIVREDDESTVSNTVSESSRESKPEKSSNLRRKQAFDFSSRTELVCDLDD